MAMVAALLGCPLSVGPACWVLENTRLPYRPFDCIYRPVVDLALHGPQMVRPLWWYLRIAAEMKPTVGFLDQRGAAS
jgi:hypothetical protein